MISSESTHDNWCLQFCHAGDLSVSENQEIPWRFWSLLDSKSFFFLCHVFQKVLTDFFFSLATLSVQNIEQKVESSHIWYIFKLKFIGKLWSPACFSKKVLLEQSFSLFMYSFGCFCTMITELNLYKRDHRAHKDLLTIWSFIGKICRSLL